MKIITEFGLCHIEKTLKGKVISDRYSFTVRIFFDSLMNFQEAKDRLTKLNITYTSSLGTGTFAAAILFDHGFLFKLCRKGNRRYYKEELVWVEPGRYRSIKSMSHQHLSNCVHFVKLLALLPTSDKNTVKTRLEHLYLGVIPILKKKHKGTLLSYHPYSLAEKTLLDKVNKLAK